jgi:hypothetical protein
MSQLVPCPVCQRHVSVSESSCPFCATVLPATLSELIVPDAKRRLKRAETLAFNAPRAVDDTTMQSSALDASEEASLIDEVVGGRAAGLIYGGPSERY